MSVTINPDNNIYDLGELRLGTEFNFILYLNKNLNGTPILYLEGITLTPKDFEVLWPADTKLDFIEDLGKHKKVWKLSEK